ncbi:MAG: aminodeoxychorismate synthase component I, partial [Bacteroidetes bacterium]|nr:aminodeoxychorismate synthase component I [Bacteroidota bacterium]
MHTPFRQFPVQQFAATKNRILSWCQGFSVCSFLDSHAYDLPHQSHECLVACGMVDSVAAEPGNALEALQRFRRQHKGKWIFGHFSYDLKNEIEPGIFSEKPSRIGFPTLFFYVPQYILRLTNDQLYLHASSGNADKVMRQIQSSPDLPSQALQHPIVLQERMSAEEYKQAIQHLLAHIHRGDCYEINYCMEFYANNVQLQPLSAYKILCAL